MITICHLDYITIERSNNILISFQDIDIKPNDFPKEFLVIDKNKTRGVFKLVEPSYDDKGVIQNVVYKGTLKGKKWIATIYNMESVKK